MLPVIQSIAKHLNVYSPSVVVQEVPIPRLLSSITRKMHEIIVQKPPLSVPRQQLMRVIVQLKGLLEMNDPLFETFSPEQTTSTIKQVTETQGLLNSHDPYKMFWETGAARCIDGALILSRKLRQDLNDHAFEELLKKMPEKYKEEITTCSLVDTFELTEKSFETVLKYLPNISEESLCKIGQNALDMWNTVQFIPQKERQEVFVHAEKLFNRRTFGEEKLLIIEAIAKIAQEDREVIVNNVVTISKEIILNASEIESLLNTINTLPKENRARIMHKTLNYFTLGLFKKCPIDAIKMTEIMQKNSQESHPQDKCSSNNSSPLKEKSPNIVSPPTTITTSLDLQKCSL